MKVQRKYLQLACLNLFLVMSVILCPHQTYAKGKKFKIYFTNAEKSIKLPLKSSQTLSVRYSKKKKASYKIKWESSNPKVVKVSKKGILTPKKTGKSVIRHVVRTKSGKVIAKKSIKVKVTPEIAIKAISCEEDAASATLIKYPNKYRWNISLKPANASLASVTFRSSNKSIATISKSGVITPLKEGNITMTAKYKKVILKRRFHVTIPLKKLTTRHQKISMPYGTFRTLSVNFKPWNASDKKLTWSTNNDTVAVVDENGHVTTRGVGVAVITATSIKNPSRKCNITITVTAENGLLSTEDLDYFDLKDGDRLMIIAHPDDDLLWGGGNMIQEIKELKEIIKLLKPEDSRNVSAKVEDLEKEFYITLQKIIIRISKQNYRNKKISIIKNAIIKVNSNISNNSKRKKELLDSVPEKIANLVSVVKNRYITKIYIYFVIQIV